MEKCSSILILLLLVCSVGCKSYHANMFVDANTSEIMILVEAVDKNGQVIISPEINYEEDIVSAKRILIPHFWNSTGYMWWQGEWLPTHRVIVVDTQPETRKWTSESQSGTSTSDQAIWVESSDSVGFSTGISVTARIDGTDDAIKFLSKYPPSDRKTWTNSNKETFDTEITSLAPVMDDEVHSKVQEVYAEQCAAFEMDELRSKKVEILMATREIVIPYFAERGITITSLGQFDGFTYKNIAIQDAIDDVFKAQQDKQVAIAEAEAAEERKLALQLKGEGAAAQTLEEAKGRAEGIKVEAEAEAEAIKVVADAKEYELEKLEKNPESYLALKNIEVEKKRIEMWDGKYPLYMIQSGDGESPNLLINTPALPGN